MRRKILAIAILCALGATAAGGLAIANSPSAAAKSAKLKLRSGKVGRYVTDARGFTLYLFEKDRGSKSSCNGPCAKVWAPYTTSGKPTAASGLSAAKLGTIKRADGTTQVTYGGHPLYHYDDDHKAGQTKGQGSKEFGAKWYVVGANGKKIDND